MDLYISSVGLGGRLRLSVYVTPNFDDEQTQCVITVPYHTGMLLFNILFC